MNLFCFCCRLRHFFYVKFTGTKSANFQKSCSNCGEIKSSFLNYVICVCYVFFANRALSFRHCRKESGCSWKKQLERYENTPAKNKREDWKIKADDRWKADKEIPNPDDAKGDDKPLVMNNPRFAPKEYRDAITQLTLKKLGKSNVQRAHERLENLGKFIPGPTYKQRY